VASAAFGSYVRDSVQFACTEPNASPQFYISKPANVSHGECNIDTEFCERARACKRFSRFISQGLGSVLYISRCLSWQREFPEQISIHSIRLFGIQFLLWQPSSKRNFLSGDRSIGRFCIRDIPRNFLDRKSVSHIFWAGRRSRTEGHL
jgi:hypothetical protein